MVRTAALLALLTFCWRYGRAARALVNEHRADAHGHAQHEWSTLRERGVYCLLTSPDRARALGTAPVRA